MSIDVSILNFFYLDDFYVEFLLIYEGLIKVESDVFNV